MGFGFTLFVLVVLIPTTLTFLLLWAFFRKKIFGFALATFWGFFLLLVLGLNIIAFFTKPMTVEQDDVYGEYIVDRNRYPGTNADWQYNHFRFEITADSLFLHETEGRKIIRTHRRKIDFLEPRVQALWTFADTNDSAHHLINSTPTLYRETFDFYYVFKSEKFGNVFVRRGKWEKVGLAEPQP